MDHAAAAGDDDGGGGRDDADKGNRQRKKIISMLPFSRVEKLRKRAKTRAKSPKNDLKYLQAINMTTAGNMNTHLYF